MSPRARQPRPLGIPLLVHPGPLTLCSPLRQSLKWGFKLRPSDTSGHLECLRGPLCLWSLLQWAGPAECFLHAASSGGTFFLASYSDFLTPLLPSSWGAGLQDMAWAPLGSLSRLLPGPLSRLVAELIPGTSRQGFSVPDDHGTSSHPRLGTPGDLQGVGGPALSCCWGVSVVTWRDGCRVVSGDTGHSFRVCGAGLPERVWKDRKGWSIPVSGAFCMVLPQDLFTCCPHLSEHPSPKSSPHADLCSMVTCARGCAAALSAWSAVL